MDPYMQQSKMSYSYLGPGGGNGDAHNVGDRVTEAGYGRIITKSGESQVIPSRSLSGNIPVSYTHLDVYKRQTYYDVQDDVIALKICKK